MGIGLFLVLLFGCSTLKVSTDYNPAYDFKKLKTFTVLYNKSKDPLTTERLVRALMNELEAKGYRPVPKRSADFFVVFHVNVTNKRQIVTDYRMIGVPYHGYCGSRHSYRYRGGTAVVPIYREINYKEGKIMVDAIDSETQKIFWRGIATDRLTSLKSPEERWKYIQKVTKKLLEPFPSLKKKSTHE